MAFIRTNLQAGLIARQLAGINRQFTTNLERLSTGLRLNRPDDSPGQFGVVVNQKLQLTALGQGITNAQNAAGMLQTAEEGINSIIDLLNRAHDLAVTAADSTLTEAQRQQAQDEITELLTKTTDSELSLILQNVKFNGIKLLSDSNQAAAIENSTLGAVGGNRESATTEGGTLIDTLGAAGAAFQGSDLATNDEADFTLNGSVDGVALASTLNTLNIAIDDPLSTNLKVGDFLEITAVNKDAAGATLQTFTDSVVVVNINPTTDIITVANARDPLSKLNASDFLTGAATDGYQDAGTDTFSLKRVAQTLLVDSTGASITTSSASGKTYDFRTGSTEEFRNALRIGVILNPSTDDDAESANLGTVLISFTESDPITAASQIQAAIENQLGGEFRSGGDLHIDVKAVAEVKKATAAVAAAAAIGTSFVSLGTKELTTTLINNSRAVFGNVSNNVSFSGGNVAAAIEVSDEIADLANVRFKFITTTTAGINKTPQMRVISDELAGFSGAQKLFDNLEIGTGKHGNDKFIITVDGEEIEVNIDVKSANSTTGSTDPLSANGLVAKIVETEEAARDTANSEATMMLARIGFDVNEATGAVAAAGAVGATAATVNDLSYFTDELDAGYFDPEALRIILQNGINNATRFAEDVNVAYDATTRTLTTTTGTRGNSSSLLIGKSFAANNTSTNVTPITDLVNTTGGTGFKGALGLNEGASSQGSGSIFTFRLGGDTDTFSITFDTLGAQNFGADLVDISNINVGTQGGAGAAITLIEQALESVSTTQTKIGAAINHMSRRIDVLETHREALQGQKARIEEIDFTEETRTLASLQILLQSSTAALAQANIIPQTLLQLLA